MFRRRLYRVSLMLVAGALSAGACAQALGEERGDKVVDLAVLELFPDDSLIAIVTPNIGNLDAKLSMVAGLLKMPMPGLLQSAQRLFGLREGLDLNRSAALVLVGTADGRSSDSVGVGLLPISDYDKLIGQFSPQTAEDGVSRISVPGTPGFLIARRGAYAVFVGPTEDERKILERAIRRPPGMPSSLTALRSWVARQEVAFIVTAAGVKWGVWQAPAALKSALDVLPPQAALGALQMIAIAMLPDIEREVAQFGIGLEIDRDGSTHVTSQAYFVKGRAMARMASGVSPRIVPPLSGLPASPYLFAIDMPGGNEPVAIGAGFAMGAMNAAGGIAAAATFRGNGEQVRALERAHAVEVKSSAQMLGPVQRAQPAFLNSYNVLHVEDSKAYLKNYAEFLTEYNALERSANNPVEMLYDVKNVQVDGEPTLEVTISLSPASQTRQASGAQAPAQSSLTDAVIGTGGKITARLAAAGPKTVVVPWGNADHLRTAIAAAKTTSATLLENRDVKMTADMLPKDAQCAVMVDMPAVFQFAETVTQVTLPQSPARFPSFPATPPVGISLRMSEGQLDTEIVLPSALLAAFGTHYQQIHGTAGK